jgi:type I site-specific restriction-modification system R (restriction) subunit
MGVLFIFTVIDIFKLMEEINLPSYHFRYKDLGQRKYIFDSFRKKYVLLTAEENVRQHFAHFLAGNLNYPSGRIGLEVSLKNSSIERRCDIVVYSSNLKPILIIECKAASIEINEAVFDQIVRYHMVLQSPFIAVTNGKRHFCCKLDNETGKWEFLNSFPSYEEIEMASKD